MSDEYGLVDFEGTEYHLDPTPGSEKRFAQLTDALGCEEMRLNSFRIPPGEEGPYHRHESQEEVYVLLDGPGRMKIDGESVDVPEGGIVRVPAAVPRKFINDTGDGEQRWLVVGAPPDGTVDNFGNFVLVDE